MAREKDREPVCDTDQTNKEKSNISSVRLEGALKDELITDFVVLDCFSKA